MDGKLIEKLDRQRYWAVILETAGLLCMLAGTIRYYVLSTPLDDDVWFAIHLAYPVRLGLYGKFWGMLPSIIQASLLPVGGLWYGVIWFMARRNKELHAALYNEMYRQHKWRYQRLTLWVVLLLVYANQGFAVHFLGSYEPTEAQIAKVFVMPVLTIIVGLLTLKISWLIYNRR
jgi:hypothetical protein